MQADNYIQFFTTHIDKVNNSKKKYYVKSEISESDAFEKELKQLMDSEPFFGELEYY